MSHDFKPGDKVVCINADHASAWGLCQGGVYTIEAAGVNPASGQPMVDLVEAFKGNPKHPPLGWLARRFEHVYDHIHAKDRDAGMVPLPPIHRPVMERPVSVTWPASAFPANARKRGA